MSFVAFLLQCTLELRCFSVMLHTVWHFEGAYGSLPPTFVNPRLTELF